MLLDWLIYGLLIWGLVAVLNATAFKKQPASLPIAWLLTVGIFFVSLFALTALQLVRYKLISQDLGLNIHPRNPADFFGAFTASWFFFSLLRKRPKSLKTQNNMVHSPSLSSAQVMASSLSTRTAEPLPHETASNATEVSSEQLWAQALAELEGNFRRSGLWAKAFSEAQGNESAAKANYLRDRVRQLSEEHRRRASEALRQEPIVALPSTQATARISHAPRIASTITATLVALWGIVLVGIIGWALFS